MYLAALSGTVNESDANLYFYAVPVPPVVMQEWLNDDLRPSLFNESAWVVVNPYSLVGIAEKFAGKYIRVPGVVGPIVKTFAAVEFSNGSHPGYMVLNMDFGTGISDWMQTEGCKSTQKGVDCEQAKHLKFADGVDMKTHDGNTMNVTGIKVEDTYVEQTWFDFLLKQAWVFEQGGRKGSYTTNVQATRASSDWRGQPFTTETASSSLLKSRYNWDLDIDCSQSGRCFYLEELNFIANT